MSLKTKKRSGFTLIELLVVVAIIGILSSIGVVIYLEQQKSSRDARRKSDLALISGALQNYFAVNKVYPKGNEEDNSALEDTVYRCFVFSNGGRHGGVNCSTRGDTPANQADWIKPLQSGGYISTMPKDPLQESLGINNSGTVYNKYINNIANPSTVPEIYFYVYTARTGGELPEPDVLDSLRYKYYYLMALLENKNDPERFGLIRSTLVFNDIRFTDWNDNLYVISSR